MPDRKVLSPEELSGSLPRTTGNVRVQGLDSTITVYRDSLGIPHVYAESTHDAFFGEGFATAQDRLWHMDYDRHRAYGRWSEFVGETGLEQDKMMRRFRIADSAHASYEGLADEGMAMLDAYTAGVNAFLDSTETLPVEYSLVGGEPEAWTPQDCIAVYTVRHILMGVFEGKLWRARLVAELGAERTAELVQGYQRGHQLILPPGVDYDGTALEPPEGLGNSLGTADWLDDPGSGSNNWVLSGSRTASGNPLMAGDPHRALDTPNVYYQNHIRSPEFDAIGLSFPGCPGFPHFGHNSNVAWCVTHAQADYQDLYIERFDPDDPSHYQYQGSWLEADVRTEVIRVRGGEDVELDLTATQHGPIILGNPARGEAVAFKYTAAAEPSRGFDSVFRMLHAESVDGLDEAMRHWVDPCNNFLLADVEGDIGYLMRGKVPVRPKVNGWLPVPGWDGEHEWNGTIPFDELPRSRNPETGYIVTANNRIVDQHYPHYISIWFSPDYRARRITERVGELRNATVANMASIHSERVSIPARTYSRLLAEVNPVSEGAAWAKTLLAQWDGNMDIASIAPTVYSAFRLKLHDRMFAHLLGDLAGEAAKASGRGGPVHLMQLTSRFVSAVGDGDTSMLPPGSTWLSIASTALEEGLAYLNERFGENTSNWTWGLVHQTRPQHTLSGAFPSLAAVLDPPSFPLGGDGDTPLSGGYSPTDPFTITGTSAARYVFDLGDWNDSVWTVPLGSSGHPGSPHYADQAQTWRKIELTPMLYDWDLIASSAESRQKLGDN